MRSLLFFFVVAVLLLGQIRIASACPSCQAALENLSETEDYDEEAEKQRNLSAAFNNSIYVMISVPYVLMGIFGFLVYRGIRKHDAKQLEQIEGESSKKDSSIPTP